MARHGERENLNKIKNNNGAVLGFETKLWQAAEKLLVILDNRNNV